MSPCTGVNCGYPQCVFTLFGISVAAPAALYGGVASTVQYVCTPLRVGSVHCVDPSLLWACCEPQAVVCACQGWFMFLAAIGVAVLGLQHMEQVCSPSVDVLKASARALLSHGHCTHTARQCLALCSCNLPLCTGLHSRTASAMGRSSDMGLSLL
jgi:hypothetical protein